MVVDVEKKMLGESNLKRLKEMRKYDRTKIYKKINLLLKDDLREGFVITNHALAIIDDVLDCNHKDSLNEVENVFRRSFKGEKFVVKDRNIKKIQELGEILRKLHKKGFGNAYKIYLEILSYWRIDRKDRARMFKILSAKELDWLNKNVGGSVGKQFLLFLTPNLNQKIIYKLAISYGRAIKYADNLSDLREDLARGYINISKENIKKYRLLVNINNQSVNIEGNLRDYEKLELNRTEQIFKEAHKLMAQVIKRNKKEKEMLNLFEEVAKSWLKQAKEKYNQY